MELFYPDGTGSGGAYYKLPLEKDGKKIEPGVSEGGKYQVDVDVDVKVPESDITGDTGGKGGHRRRGGRFLRRRRNQALQ
jgi:hypothetical protein